MILSFYIRIFENIIGWALALNGNMIVFVLMSRIRLNYRSLEWKISTKILSIKIPQASLRVPNIVREAFKYNVEAMPAGTNSAGFES